QVRGHHGVVALVEGRAGRGDGPGGGRAAVVLERAQLRVGAAEDAAEGGAATEVGLRDEVLAADVGGGGVWVKAVEGEVEQVHAAGAVSQDAVAQGQGGGRGGAVLDLVAVGQVEGGAAQGLAGLGGAAAGPALDGVAGQSALGQADGAVEVED